MSAEYTRVLNDQIALLESENEALLLEIERLQEIEDKPAVVQTEPINRPYEMAIPPINFCPAHYGFATDRRMAISQEEMQAEFAIALKLIMQMVSTMTFGSQKDYEASIRKVADVNRLKVLTELLNYSSAESLLGKRQQDYGYYDDPNYDNPYRYRLRK